MYIKDIHIKILLKNINLPWGVKFYQNQISTCDELIKIIIGESDNIFRGWFEIGIASLLHKLNNIWKLFNCSLVIGGLKILVSSPLHTLKNIWKLHYL